MTDVWKSTGKKFCEICKCWFSDNKTSAEWHERGLRHKANIQKKLSEMGQKKKAEDQKQIDLRIALSQMEQGAAAAMGQKYENPKSYGAQPKPSGPVYKPPQPPKTNSYSSAKNAVKEQKKQLKELKKTAKRSAFWADEEVDEDQIEWVRAEADGGQFYWWNFYTGDTRFDAPDRYFTTAEYNEKYAKIAKKFGVGTEDEQAANEAMLQPSYYTLEEFQAMYGGQQQQPQIEPISAGFSSASYVVERKNVEKTEVIPDELPIPSERHRTKKSRFDSQQPPKITIELKQPKPEPDSSEPQTSLSKPEPEIRPDLIMVKATDQVQRRAKPSLLGPWVPVQKKKEDLLEEKIVLDDLPDEAREKKLTEEKKELMEIEEGDIAFGERQAPVKKEKKPKVIEFKKRKNVNISTRTRLNE